MGTQPNVIWDLEEMISNYTYLFMHPEVFHNRFSRDQLEQGFWMIIGFKDFSVSESLYHKDLSFDRQSACVKTMYPLFRDFFSIDRLGTSVWMWWDCVATPFNDDAESEFHPFNTSSTGHQLQQVIFDTLCKILMLENVACHFDAIHGLRPAHLQSYLDEFVFRFNRRRTRHAAFGSLLAIATGKAPMTYKVLTSPEATA